LYGRRAGRRARDRRRSGSSSNKPAALSRHPPGFDGPFSGSGGADGCCHAVSELIGRAARWRTRCC